MNDANFLSALRTRYGPHGFESDETGSRADEGLKAHVGAANFASPRLLHILRRQLMDTVESQENARVEAQILGLHNERAKASELKAVQRLKENAEKEREGAEAEAEKKKEKSLIVEAGALTPTSETQARIDKQVDRDDGEDSDDEEDDEEDDDSLGGRKTSAEDVTGRESEDEKKTLFSDVRFSVESVLFDVGSDLGARGVERLVSEKLLRFPCQRDILKFVCRDVWLFWFTKQANRLQTNRRGGYIILDETHPWILTAANIANEAIFICGLIRGSLTQLNINVAHISFDTRQLPVFSLHISLVRE